MFLRYASISSMGARATAAYVRSWFSRCTSRPSRWSTSNAQPTQLFFWPWPSMKCFRKSWLRPLNSCARVTLPNGPSKVYSFSMRTQGNARCSALNSSRKLVNAFSLASRAARASSHSPRETTRCVGATFSPVPVSVRGVAFWIAAWLSLIVYPPSDFYCCLGRGNENFGDQLILGRGSGIGDVIFDAEVLTHWQLCVGDDLKNAAAGFRQI